MDSIVVIFVLGLREANYHLLVVLIRLLLFRFIIALLQLVENFVVFFIFVIVVLLKHG